MMKTIFEVECSWHMSAEKLRDVIGEAWFDPLDYEDFKVREVAPVVVLGHPAHNHTHHHPLGDGSTAMWHEHEHPTQHHGEDA